MAIISLWVRYFICQVIFVLTARTVRPPPRSPCPEIFKYERVKIPSTGGDIIFPSRDHMFWKATVVLPAHTLKPQESVFLKIVLAVPTTLPTNYVGRVEFHGNRRKFLKGDASSGKYDVIFPGNSPVPNVLKLIVNDVVICSGIAPRSSMTTKIFLEHSLFPFRVNFTKTRSYDFWTADDVSNEEESEEECGDYTMSNPLVVRGRTSTFGEWPWLVPIFIKTDTERGKRFLCGGTLIADSIVLTAAHCMRDIRDPKSVMVYPGRRNIHERADAQEEAVPVWRIIEHPDFVPDTLYSDLAAIELVTPVTWSANVFPACLWTEKPDLQLIVGRTATVVGWGSNVADRTKLSSEAKSAELPIVSQETCLRSSREFYFLSSNRTLCAGARDGSGPCNGDSGSGLYLPVRSRSGSVRWHLRGVVSLSLLDPATQRCDLHRFTVFTDVAQFQSWLREIIHNTRS